MSYTPKPGSKPALAIEYLSQHPDGVYGTELATALGITTERLVANLGIAMANGLIGKRRDGQRAIYSLCAPVDEHFKCAVWDDGTIYLEGVRVDDGGVALTLAQSRVLAKVIKGQIHV